MYRNGLFLDNFFRFFFKFYKHYFITIMLYGYIITIPAIYNHISYTNAVHLELYSVPIYFDTSIEYILITKEI